MIKRIPRYAETTFARLCAVHGSLCHHSEEDENGWDYLVEFPEQPGPEPADMRSPPDSAYVQVKSTRQKQLTCRVKLSNALRAAQSPQPWFIVLIVIDARQRATVYAVHVWKELIQNTLMAVRQAEINKNPLNQKYLTIRFDVADKRETDLLPWMEETIKSFGHDYQQKKKTISQTVGFEHGYGIVNFTVEAPGDEIANNFLGLGSGLPVKDFQYTPARFGLISSEPQIKVSSGVVQISPLPLGPCELRLSSSKSPSSIILSGRAYTLGPPFADQRVRFSADFVEIAFSLNGKSEFDPKLNVQEKTDLKTIENFATLNGWLVEGSVNIQIWFKNKRIFSGTLKSKYSPQQINWPLVAKITGLLRLIATREDQSRLRLSMADMRDAWHGLATLEQVADGISMRWEFPPSPDVPARFSSLIYYSVANVCDWTFYVLDERSTLEDIIMGEVRRITCGPPQRIDAYCLQNATEDQRRMMEDDYERHLARQIKSGTPYGLGNIRNYERGRGTE